MTRESTRYDHQHKSSREIERDVQETRTQMDRTLEEIGGRLHPKHLFDEAVKYFRSSNGGTADYRQKARRVGREAAHQVKQHPIPALLCGAGLAWLLFEDRDESRTSHVDRRKAGKSARPQPLYAAWDEQYDWPTSGQDESTWKERAQQAIEDIRTTIADQSVNAKEKLRKSAGKLVDVSGRKREEIHAHWADLAAHSGSYIDARTGEPYDESYGEEWQPLAAAHFASSHDWSDEEEATWSEQANSTLERVKHAFSDTGQSAKHQLRKAAHALSELVSQSRGASKQYGRRASHGAKQAMRSGRQGAERMRQGFERGYAQARHSLEDAVEQSPLAVGAAILGLGLIVGLTLPATRRENRLMGEASDDVKREVMRKGSEVIERGERATHAAIDAAAEEMQEQGLTPENAGKAVQRVAARTAETVRQEMPDAETVKGKATAVAERAAEAAREEASQEHRPNRPR
ncbi:MAG: DUF3618 domain-containing protein [Pirellulales bacterium]